MKNLWNNLKTEYRNGQKEWKEYKLYSKVIVWTGIVMTIMSVLIVLTAEEKSYEWIIGMLGLLLSLILINQGRMYYLEDKVRKISQK